VALAIDGSTPAIATQATGSVATVTTASFTPPAGSLLLIRYSANTIDPNDPGNPTITDSLGGHLTYTSVDIGKRPTAPLADGQVATWTAVVGSSAAMTVTVTNGAASPNRHAALCVTVLTGADTTTPVGAHGASSAITSTSSIAQNYTASATAGWGFLVVCDWFDAGAETAGTGCTLEGSADIASNYTYAFIRRTAADDSNGVTNTLRATLPGASTSIRWAWIEILPAAATQAWLPQRIRRRPAWPRPLPTSVRLTPYVRAQVNPPIPVQEVDQARRLRGMLGRRGKVRNVVPPQVNPPLPVQEVDQPRRVRGMLLRRGRGITPTPTQTVATPPAYPFGDVVQPRRPRGLPVRRGRYAVPVRDQVNPPFPVAEVDQARRVRGLFQRRGRSTFPPPAQDAPIGEVDQPRRPRGWLIRRGRTVTPPPQQVAVPPAYPFQDLGQPRRARGWLQRRGKTVPPVPDQVVVTPPAYPPATVAQPRRIRGLLARRGRTVAPVQSQAAPVAPAYPFQGLVQPRRIRGLLSRRGRSAQAPLAAAPVNPFFPLGIARRLTRLLSAVRRGHAAQPQPVQAQPILVQRRRTANPARRRATASVRPVGVQLAPAPPVLVPKALRIRLFRPFAVRGTAVNYVFDGVDHQCFVTRPTTGVTTRPGTGTTSWAGSITLRPSGTTSRPDTGETDAPC
jgi:hypothetical protein